MADVRLNLNVQSELNDLITLAKWYRIENDHLVEQCADNFVFSQAYVVFFGASTDTQFVKCAKEFIGEQNIHAVCLYQPLATLLPALAFNVQLDLSADARLSFRQSLRCFASKFNLEGAFLTEPADLKAPGLLIMDMDSTAIEIECIDEIARLADVYEDVASVTAQAMAGQLGFSDSLHQRVAKLEGIELALIQQLKENLPLMEGIQELCQTLKTYDWHIVLASGGFTWFAEALKGPLQLDAFYANTLEISEQCLTGKVVGEIVDARKKADILVNARDALQFSRQQTIAIGDGANDLMMMAEAGTGIAIHGKPKVVEHADTAICNGSLLQLLYFITIPN